MDPLDHLHRDYYIVTENIFSNAENLNKNFANYLWVK